MSMANKKLTAVEQAILKTENLIKQYKGMKQNALSKRLESNHYQYAIQEFQSLIHHVLTPLLELEKEQHKETWFDSTAQFDNAAEMTYKKSFEQYYNETYGNKESN